MPQPKQTPWVRKSCQIWFAKEAATSPAVWKRIPINSVVRVPNRWMDIVAIGETSIAVEMDSPPTKAKSSRVAPGYVLEAK